MNKTNQLIFAECLAKCTKVNIVTKFVQNTVVR